jgi:XTP/dITP diphosphohydrolase
MEKKIVFATSNPNKVREVKEMLLPLGIDVLSLADAGIQSDPEEIASDFEGNARIKALAIVGKTDYPVLADDSGLCVHALDGFPGIYSARFMQGSPYEAKCNALIAKLADNEDKDATFYTAMVYIDKKHGIDVCFLGRTEGKIMPTFDKEAPDQFGYDPVFYSYDLKKTFGRSTAAEKDSVSHRGRALRQLVDYLKKEQA